MKALRCPVCRGNMLPEPDVAGYIIEFKCLSCGRSTGEIPAADLRRSVPSLEHVKRAQHGQGQFFWTRDAR